ncbi:MAG TPA: SDR family NAD(P)-dependent oxidoreductase [Nitrospiraceae bacterium]|nr:SDR family NAD(P)-dependent oxidoreductase [Nitrospiraceae bacterium]
MEDLENRWALVTGASSGFGVQFANLLAERKANLVLVARRTEPMEKLAEELRQRHFVKVVVEGMNLARTGVGVELKSRLDARGIAIEILVNNAGYGLYGAFLDQPLEKTVDMLQLNMITVTELTYVFARDMVKRRGGHILLTASLLGYQAVPGYAAYAATKAYVLLFGEALHQELQPHGIAVTALCPGMSATSFGEVAGQRLSPLLRMMIMKPHPVAKAGVLAMLERRATVVPGFFNKAVVFLDRLMPRPMQRMILGKVIAG